MPSDSNIPPVVPVAESELQMMRHLHNEMEIAIDTLVPIVRKYVDDLRGVRMALDSECRHILQTSRELGEMTKMTPQINELVKAINALEKALTPEMRETLAKIVKS